ncbi:hypothetical protein U1Q18_022256 [Sarracenia purpurea var. burkii]
MIPSDGDFSIEEITLLGKKGNAEIYREENGWKFGFISLVDNWLLRRFLISGAPIWRWLGRRSRRRVLAKKSDLWFSVNFTSQICKSPRMCGDAAAVMIDVPTGEKRWSDDGAVVPGNGGAGRLPVLED